MSGNINIDGTWKNLIGSWANIGGVWKKILKITLNISGIWKEVWKAPPSLQWAANIGGLGPSYYRCACVEATGDFYISNYELNKAQKIRATNGAVINEYYISSDYDVGNSSLTVSPDGINVAVDRYINTPIYNLHFLDGSLNYIRGTGSLGFPFHGAGCTNNFVIGTGNSNLRRYNWASTTQVWAVSTFGTTTNIIQLDRNEAFGLILNEDNIYKFNPSNGVQIGSTLTVTGAKKIKLTPNSQYFYVLTQNKIVKCSVDTMTAIGTYTHLVNFKFLTSVVYQQFPGIGATNEGAYAIDTNNNIVHVDDNLNKIWEVAIGGSYNEYYCIVTDDNGSIYVYGTPYEYVRKFA